MKEIFEKHFAYLFIFNKKLKDLTPNFHKGGFYIVDGEFEFYFVWDPGMQSVCYLKFIFRRRTAFYIFDTNFSIEKNIGIFYIQYIATINDIIADINKENDDLDKVKQNNKRILKELEDNHKMLIFL